MDGDLKMRRVQSSGVGKRDKGGRQASTIVTQEDITLGREIQYGIRAKRSQVQDPARAVKKKDPAPTSVPHVQPPIKRGESMRKPTGGSKISRWFSAKEPAEDHDDGPVNVSVRRPLKPKQSKPGGTGSEQKVPLPLPPKMLDSSLSAKKPSDSSRKLADKKESKRFELEHAIQRAPSAVRPATSYL